MALDPARFNQDAELPPKLTIGDLEKAIEYIERKGNEQLFLDIYSEQANLFSAIVGCLGIAALDSYSPYKRNPHKYLAQSRFPDLRAVPSRGGVAGTGVATGPFALDLDAPPCAAVSAPGALLTHSPVAVAYTLDDSEGDLADVEVRVSLDGGATFARATLAAGAPEGTTALATGGAAHTFLWDAAADLPAGAPATVILEVRPTQATDPARGAGAPARTLPFVVDLGPIVSATIDHVEGVTGTIAIAFRLSAAVPAIASARVELDAGAGFAPATPAPGGSATAGLLADAAGRSYTFLWASAADLPRRDADGVRIRITPVTAREGEADEVAVDVRNDVAPVLAVETPAGLQGGDVPIAVRIVDPNGGTVDLTIARSLDGGATYAPAAVAGATGLAASEAGTTHTLTWRSEDDAPFAATATARVRVAIAGGAGAVETGDFALQNLDATELRAEVASIEGTSGEIRIRYALHAPAPAAVAARVEVDPNDGTGFRPASQAGGAPLAALAAGPGGVLHDFVWASATDFPGRDLLPARIRVTPRLLVDGGAGEADATVRNDVEPAVAVATPTGVQSGAVAITFTLADPNAGTHDVEVLRSIDGAPFTPAALAAGSAVAGLASSPGGRSHTVAWESGRDAPGVRSSAVRIRVRVAGASAAASATTGDFALDNGILADLAIGQPTLFSADVDAYGLHLSAEGAGAAGVAVFPGLAGDALAVADPGNHRVLIFDPAPAATFEPAAVVLGQEDALAHAPNRGLGTPGLDGLATPLGVATDGARLAVADRDNDRVLVWDAVPLSTAANAADAEIVGLSAPEGVFFDAAGRLFVADTGAGCVRVYGPDLAHALDLVGPGGAPIAEPCGGVALGNGQVVVAARGSGEALVWSAVPVGAAGPLAADFGIDGRASVPDEAGEVGEHAAAGFAGALAGLVETEDGLSLRPALSDAFDGAAGAAPSAALWTTSAGSAGVFTLGGGALHAAASSGSHELTFRVDATGDFDVRLDLRSLLYTLPRQSALWIHLTGTEVGAVPDESGRLRVLSGVEVTRGDSFVALRYATEIAGLVSDRRTVIGVATPIVLRLARAGTVHTL